MNLIFIYHLTETRSGDYIIDGWRMATTLMYIVAYRGLHSVCIYFNTVWLKLYTPFILTVYGDTSGMKPPCRSRRSLYSIDSDAVAVIIRATNRILLIYFDSHCLFCPVFAVRLANSKDDMRQAYTVGIS